MTAADILPRNRSLFETALVVAGTDELPVPLRQIVDPRATLASFLPFLASHESVDLWFPDWSEARKRLMIEKAPILAAMRGTQAAVPAFLAFVDAILIDKITYPTRFVLGHSALGRVPIGHRPFVARHLVKVVTYKPPRSIILGRSHLGRGVIRTPSREPMRRCLIAMTAAKSPETEYRVDFAHKRHIVLSDSIPIDGSNRLGQYVDRIRL